MIKVDVLDSVISVVDTEPSDASTFLFREMGGRWDKTARVWVFPKLRNTVYRLKRAFPTAEVGGDYLPRLLNDVPVSLSEDFQEGRLREYQLDALKFLVQPTRGKLLALSPRLGKTVVSISAVRYLGYRKILVVAPLSLLYNWRRSIFEWDEYGTHVSLVRDNAMLEYNSERHWFITNYDHVVRHPNIFLQSWDVVIFDESVLLKNRDSKRSDVCFQLAGRAKDVWELSGAPITFAVDDLYSQFKILNGKAFSSYWRFANTYCWINNSTPWGPQIMGSRTDIDFRHEFSDIMFVRSMNEVVEVPEEIYETIDIDLLPDQRRVHDKLLDHFILELSSGDVPVAMRMTQILKMLQVVSNLANVQPDQNVSAKTRAVVELIETEQLPRPTIIWTHWRITAVCLLASLRSTFPKLRVELLSSDLDEDERDVMVTAFQAGEIDIMIVGLGVGKYGLTMSAANSVVYYDRSYDSDAIVQSGFRVRHINLTHNVLVYTLMCVGSADKLVDTRLGVKLRELVNLTGLDLADFLKGLKHDSRT